MIDEQQFFERFHAALDVQPTPGAYDRMRSALTRSDVRSRTMPTPDLRWLLPSMRFVAVVMALLLAVVALTALLALHRFLTAPIPGDYGPPPAGIPLLYLQDPTHPDWVIGYDWSGKPRGTVKLPLSASHIRMAPDGSRFVYKPTPDSSGGGGGGQYFDRLGRPITNGLMAVDPTQVTNEIWADDNRHVCFTESSQNDWILYSRLPGQADRQVYVAPLGQSTFSAITLWVFSCSFHHDYALVEQTTNKADFPVASRLLTIRLSTGQVLNDRDLGKESGIVASQDAVYDAENSAAASDKFPQRGLVDVIVKISDPTLRVALDPSVSVLAFSADDSLVLVQSNGTTGSVALEILDWRSGRVVWRHDLQSEFLRSYAAAQSGGDFAIGVQPAPTDPTACPTGPTPPAVPPHCFDPLWNVIIVHADGTTTKIPGLNATTW